MRELKTEAVIIPRAEREAQKDREASGAGWIVSICFILVLLTMTGVINP